MAKKQIISIETGQAVKNIGELRENIKYYKKALEEADLTAGEHQAILTRLQENQAALRNAMHATTATFTDITNAATASNVAFDKNNKLVKEETLSYNELVRELDILKQQWRATTNQAERADLSERINAVNDRLKDMDKSVGVFGRNVGNYIGAVDHLTNSLSSMGKGAAGMVAPLKGVTMGFKTLSATPAIAILGILANVLQKVIDNLHSSEENAQNLTKAMAPFEAIGDAVIKMLQAAGQALVVVVGWVGKLTQAILGNNDAAEKRLKIAKEQNALDISMRERMVQDAKDEREVAELRAKASERVTYTAKERLAFLQEAGRLESEISKRGVEDARKQYQIIKEKNAISKSGKEELDAEAKAYTDMIKAETAYYQQLRQINQGITRARKELIKEERDAAKAVKDAAAAKIASEKDYLTQLLDIVKKGGEDELKIRNTISLKEKERAEAEARQKITNAKELARALELIEKTFQVKLQKNQQDHDNKVRQEQVRSIKNRAALAQKGSVEYATAMLEAAKVERDKMARQMDETDAEFQARKIESERAVVEAQAALNDALLKETTDGLQAQMAALREGSVEQLALALQVAEEKLAGMYQGIDETQEQYLARRLEAEKAVREAEDALTAGQVEQDRVILEQRMATMQEGSLEYLAAEVEMKQFELDTLHQLEGESNEAFRLRELQAEKAYSDALKAQWQARLQVMQQAAAGVSGILGSIADALESNTEMTQEEAERVKNLRIAGATIDMLQGAVTAYAGAQSLGVPMGPIIGAINAAAVVAAGIANIAKIKATKVDANSSSSATPSVPAQVEAPTFQPEVTQVRSVTSASEEDRLDQMASDHRVFILSSDLEADRNATQVRTQETTF